MPQRTIKQKQTTDHFLATLTEFPKAQSGLIYVRQSSLAQMRHNIHSFEMQTDKFLEHFRAIGCTGNIDIVADDEALSGTLDIHKRPGLTRVMEMIEKEAVGWVGAVHVNRLTRDPWHITPAVLMKTCYEHNVWISTLRMNFNFKDPYCQRVFMLEAEEAARHLDWMKLILGGAKLVVSSNGYYDGRNLPAGYIVDRTDPKRMKLVVYRPHAEIVFWLFKRYLELDGNFPQLLHEVERMPYLFPPFDGWVDPKNVSRFAVKQFDDGLYESYYKPTVNGLKSILTNPVYIGWWIPIEGEVVIGNHEAIVPEALFWYAFKRLATTNLNGERLKPLSITRQTNHNALLIKVLKDTDKQPIYVEEVKGRLVYKKLRHEWMGEKYGFRITASPIDAMFLEKLFERIVALENECIDWEDTIVKAQEERDARNTRIKKSIKEAQRQMKHIVSVMADPDNPLPASMKQEYIAKYQGLEGKVQELEAELTPTDEEDENLAIYRIHQLIPRIRTEWHEFTFATRLLVISGLVRQVILSQPSSGFLKMEIEWKFPQWGIDTGHLRKLTSKAAWTTDEDSVLAQLYPTGEVMDILQALPIRNWKGIIERAIELGIRRELSHRASMDTIKRAGIPFKVSFDDWEYARSNGLSSESKNPQWSR